MNTFSLATLSLLSSAFLMACSQPPPARSSSSSSRAPATMVGRQVGKALTTARSELRQNNISLNDGVRFDYGDKSFHRVDLNLPEAEITPQGDFIVAGKVVALSPEQRTKSLAYREDLIGLAEIGMDIGARGADLAGQALGGALVAIFGSESDEAAFNKKMETEGEKLKMEALKICGQLPGILASQQGLEASVPEFKPYATMTEEDIKNCGDFDRPENKQG